MMHRRRQVVLAVLVGAGLVAAVMTARDDRPTGTEAAAPMRTSNPAAASGDLPVTDLKLELLDSPRDGLHEPRRNPFRFEARPASAAPRAPATPAPSRVATPSGPSPIPLRFIGLVDAPTQAGRIAIVSDGRGNVFSGKEGDIIEGRYRVLRVSTESVELSYIDGRGRQTIRLSGQ